MATTSKLTTTTETAAEQHNTHTQTASRNRSVRVPRPEESIKLWNFYGATTRICFCYTFLHCKLMSIGLGVLVTYKCFHKFSCFIDISYLPKDRRHRPNRPTHWQGRATGYFPSSAGGFTKMLHTSRGVTLAYDKYCSENGFRKCICSFCARDDNDELLLESLKEFPQILQWDEKIEILATIWMVFVISNFRFD